MSKNGYSRGVSVRGTNDYLDIRIFSDGKIVFKGGCPVGDEAKVKALFDVLVAKGIFTDRIERWFE